MFSKACEYGIKASIHISQRTHAGEHTSLTAVADAIESPQAFTSKVLQILANKQIIESVRGAGGGYRMHTGQKGPIPLSKIVAAIDGDSIYKGCGLGLDACNANKPCPLHDEFVHVRERLRIMLEQTYIEDLATKVDLGAVLLKR